VGGDCHRKGERQLHRQEGKGGEGVSPEGEQGGAPPFGMCSLI